MNLIEFYATYQQYGDRDKIIINCSIQGCQNSEEMFKSSAYRNIKINKEFLCRSHCFTNEGRQRIRKAASYKRSEETKQRMSKSKKELYQTEQGKQIKRTLSRHAAQQHTNTNLDKSKRKVLYFSAKNNNEIRVCNSSYEFIALEQFIEKDPNIKSYQTQVPYEINNRSRSLDVLIEYHGDRPKKAIEIKPKKRLNEEKHKERLEDSKINAEKEGWDFEIWTEENLNIKSVKQTTALADEYRKTHFLVDYAAYRQERNRQKGKRHYNNRIKEDKVVVYCDYCKKYHFPLRKTYENNIKRNGTYICEAKGGYIGGSKPKPALRKENPYAALEQKQCNKCQRILPFECFSPDKSRRDGWSSRCKECRANFYRKQYQEK